jgi:hypothetical protein
MHKKCTVESGDVVFFIRNAQRLLRKGHKKSGTRLVVVAAGLRPHLTKAARTGDPPAITREWTNRRILGAAAKPSHETVDENGYREQRLRADQTSHERPRAIELIRTSIADRGLTRLDEFEPAFPPVPV